MPIAMGNCVGGETPEGNVFKVKNINDNKNLVQRGLMEVTQTELVYIDSTTREDWHWPLKYLRKYGCDGDVFTFEAGRKCPGGEGLYAFSTKKASVVFELVAKNINQGELQPPGELSPFSEPQALESSVLNFPPRRQSASSPSRTDQPSYTNLDIMGNPLQNGDHSSSINPDIAAETNKSAYREVVFEKPPEEHPKPSSDTQRGTSYSKIDFEQTAKYSRDMKTGMLSDSSVPGTTSTSHGRTSSTSMSSASGHHHHKPGGRSGGGGRSRVHTYTSGNSRDRNVSKSESSFSSQNSLTESSRDVRNPNKANGVVLTGASSSPDPNSSMYQNIQVGGGTAGLQEPQQQYQNVSVGAGSINQVFENGNGTATQQQPNYCNVSLSSAGNSSAMVGGGASLELNASSSSIRLNGHPMGNYAQLELSSDFNKKKERSMSSSASGSSAQQSSYLQLDFPAENGSSSAVPQPSNGMHGHQAGRRSASVGAVIPVSSETPSAKVPGIIHQNIPEEEVGVATPPQRTTENGGVPAVKDPTKVEYEMLNFPAMQALSELSTQREQEIEKERELREKEKANPSHGKKRR